MTTMDIEYRFPHWKDATWNSYARHRERYGIIKPYLGTDLIGAEIGVYKGGFAEFLRLHCTKLYLVDLWYRGGAFWHSGIANDSRVQTVINLLEVYKSEIEAGKVEIVVDKSMDFLGKMPDEHFDFLYVDASHKFAHTLAELEGAQSKVKVGGYIIGDDYNPDPTSRQHGVYRAVNVFMEKSGYEMKMVESCQFVMQRTA